MPRSSRRHARPFTRRARLLLTALLGAVLAVGTVPVTAVSASAVGPAILSIEITPVDTTTGDVVTTAGFNQQNNRLGYRIGYSCSVAECTDAVVTLPAAALDPTYGTFRIHRYETWTPPAGGGATIANSITAGVTVRLGNVAAGTSSTFLVQYVRDIDTSAPGVTAPAYFPDGYEIQNSATIASPNAVASATADAPSVTWQISLPTAPSIIKTGPASVRPDVDLTYRIAMSDGCFSNRGSGRWTAAGNLQCAKSYTVVDRLPARAQFVSASDGGTYDAATQTVTWSGSGATAAGGWGVSAFSGWSQGFGYNPRSVTVRYPASAFPESAGGADFSVPVTNNADVSVTYLDDGATTKTATTSFTHDVVRVEPFGRADQSKISTSDAIVAGERHVNVPPKVAGLTCPVSGRDEWGRVCSPGQTLAPFSQSKQWFVESVNRGNATGVSTIVDKDLGDSPARVRRIDTTATSPAAKIAYTVTNGTTSTSDSATGSYTAPAGSWITSATVTSGSLAGPNIVQTGTAGTVFRVTYSYEVPVGTPFVQWSNTATATMTYPDHPQIEPIETMASGTVTFREWPKVVVPVATPGFSAGFDGAPIVEGGGQVVPAGKVTFNVRGSTTNIPANRSVSPQYVFIAPAGWKVLPNSAAFAAGAVPPGVSFTYKNVTVGGATRQAVIASWPTAATFGMNATWPTMTVAASPTSSVVAGTNSQASVWAGDARNTFEPSTTTWSGKIVDATDVDGDGNQTEAFASANTNLVVSGVARLDVVKEICFVTPKGSCDWISNPDVVVGVDPDASDIRYRVSFVNSGNTVLTNLVGYDVLPHLADGRGSTFAETLNTITSKSANLTLTYSSSTNPCRAEVLPSNPGCKTGWATTASGASAIRAQVTGTLAPGGSTRFEFTANVVPGAPAGAVACNSVAIDSSSTLPAEPRPVCATTQEADLKVSIPDRLPLQAGRPGTVPFTITNLGGSAAAPATVDIAIPAGIRITSVTPMGWTCGASDVASDGAILGPVTLTCSPVTDSGAPRTLTINTPDALNLPAVIPGGELVGEKTCFAATVTGIMSDPVNTNNNDTACFVVAQGKNLLKLTKDDGRTSVAMGEEFTYTIDVANLLTGETLSDVAVTDELPSTLAFVSANAGGTVSNQSASDSDGLRPGGTVTWPVSTLAAAGVIRNGDIGTGGAGSTQALTVTVRVVQAAETDKEISNSARATAIDPTLPGATLSASDDDTNELVRSSAISLTKTTDVETVKAIDDTITYSFLVTNTGDVTLSDITVEETQFTGAGNAPQVTCIDGAAALAPGDSTTCTAAYLITQADLDAGSVQNTATASGTAPTGVETPTSKPSTATVTVAQTPTIALEKTALPATVRAAGDTIEYTFTVTNTGNVSVSDVVITETAFTGTGDDIKVVCDATNAAPQQSVVCTGSYKVTQADVNAGRIDNTAIATAVASSDVNVASDPSSVAMTIVAEPGISLVKSATPTDLVLNDKVTYSFVITNTGNVSIQDIAVAEGAFTGTGELSAIDCGDDRTLDPDKQLICEADYVITQDDVDAGVLSNTATATATAPTGSISSDASTVELSVDQLPQLSLLKTADVGGLTAVGEEVEYRFRVTNTGNVTLTEIAVLEQNFSGTNPLPSITCDDNRLLPGEYVECVAPYSVTQEDIDAGSLTNTATANANSPGSDQPITAEPSTLVLPFTGATAIGLTKTGTPIDVNSDSRITANDRIRWSFSVTNDGAATLTDLAISDPMAGTITCTATELSPGKRTDCAATAEYEITAADATTGEVRNVATASASGIGTATISSGEAHAVVQVGMVPPASTGSLSITGNDPRINLLLAFLALLAGISAMIATRRQSSAGVSR